MFARAAAEFRRGRRGQAVDDQDQRVHRHLRGSGAGPGVAGDSPDFVQSRFPVCFFSHVNNRSSRALARLPACILSGVSRRLIGRSVAQHTDKVWAMAVTKDGGRLVSGGADSLLNVWKDTTAQEQEEVCVRPHPSVEGARRACLDRLVIRVAVALQFVLCSTLLSFPCLTAGGAEPARARSQGADALQLAALQAGHCHACIRLPCLCCCSANSARTRTEYLHCLSPV